MELFRRLLKEKTIEYFGLNRVIIYLIIYIHLYIFVQMVNYKSKRTVCDCKRNMFETVAFNSCKCNGFLLFYTAVSVGLN